jgi:CDP-diglyceride synthetase
MGSVQPGHGAVLDRLDALLFVAPAAFVYLRLILP